jgi:transposase
MKRGQRKLVPAPGQQHWEHLFGAYNWRTDCVSWQFASRKNSASFIAFIEYLMTVCYPTQKVILVTDNASYHKSQASLAALSLFENRLSVIWLPPYNPFLNPIERFWRHLKDIACANKLFSGLDALAESVRLALCQQNLCDNPDRFVFLKNFQSFA